MQQDQNTVITEATHLPCAKVDGPSYLVTVCGRATDWTEAGSDYLTKIDAYSQCVRRIIDSNLKGLEISKPDLKDYYGLSSRLYNSAELMATGEYKSLVECKALALAEAKRRYWLTIDKYVNAYLLRDEKGMRCLLKQLKGRRHAVAKHSEPIAYFPGRDIYQRQHELSTEEFEKQYYRARNRRIVAVGSWDEPPCCNSELQVHYVGKAPPKPGQAGSGHIFQLVHSRKVLCQFKLPRRNGEMLLARLKENGIAYTYKLVTRPLNKAELNQLGITLKPGDPVPTKTINQKQHKLWYIPLTVGILRDAKKQNRWQVRITWSQPGIEPYPITDTFLSWDTNSDSIAFSLIKLVAGEIKVLWKSERFFEENATNGKDRLRRLHGIFNDAFARAKKARAAVVGEELNLEGGKTGFGGLSKMLHRIPYRVVIDMSIRKGFRFGVPVLFINAAYTSILGGLLIDTNRDKAATVFIGAKASALGIEYLERLCEAKLKAMATPEALKYKVEVKHKFSEVVRIHSVSGSCQSVAVAKGRGALGTKDNPLRVVVPARDNSQTHRLSLILSSVTKHRKRQHWLATGSGRRVNSCVFLVVDTGSPLTQPGKAQANRSKRKVPSPVALPSA